MSDKIGLRQIETFYYAAKLGSFSKAAETLRVSQPTVSEHIARLERLLGVTLFERTRRRITLTDAGRLYYEYCQKIVRLREEASQAVEQLKGLLRGRLVLGASTIPGTYLLPDIVAAFHKRYPQIEIEVRITDSAKVEAGLLSGEWQVGFMGRRPQRKELEALAFAEDEVVLVSKRKLGKMSAQDLLGLDFVVREEGSATQAVFEEALRRCGVDVKGLRIVARFGSTEALKQAVLTGLGVGAVSRLAVEKEIRSGRLHMVDVEGLQVRRAFYMVFRGRGAVSPAARVSFWFALNR